MSDVLDRYIRADEGIGVEFKRCGSQPSGDTFETICSFANRQGGSILLGVNDDGAVEGVPEASALPIERSISNVVSNPNLFNVSPLVEFERLHDSEGRLVIRVWVPMGPSLYTFKGAVYDRVADADVRVKSDAQIASMMARKQGYYSERTVDELVGFCEKWLPDSFVLDGAQRKSARDVIVRELVCNCLIHREFVSPHIARITIDGEGIRTRNASRALFAGPVTLESLDPTPKNPIIANFFTRMGRSEELGSGTRSLYKFSRLYTGKDPVLEDGDLFTAFVPAPPVMTAGVAGERGQSAGADAMADGAGKILRRNRARTEVEAVVEDLLARYGSFPASAVAEKVVSVGERTVRRYLAAMVKEGKLASVPRGRSTTYHAVNMPSRRSSHESTGA